MLNKQLISLCAKSKKYIFLSVCVKWLALLCNIVITIEAAYLIGAIFTNTSISLLPAVIIFSASIISRFACHILDSRFSHEASHHAKQTLRVKVFDKLLNLGISYTQHTTTASVVQMAGEGIETLENYFGKYLPQFFYAMLAPVTLFAALSFISIKTAAILLACVPLIPLSIIMFMKIAKRVMKGYWGNYTDLTGSFLESLQGLTELKLFSADSKQHQRLNDEAEGFRKTTMKVLSMQLNSITIMDIIAYGGAAAGSIIALFELQAGQISIGGFVAIILLSAEFFLPLRLLGSFFHVATTGIAASEKIFSLLNIEGNSTKAASPLSCEINSITLKDLTFSYSADMPVLKHIHMHIKRNEFIAIVGESGSGKSTIAALLIKMLHAGDGHIFINDQDINTVDSASLLSNIYLLSTDSHIFNGTIRDNLQMANPNATESQMINALKDARLLNSVQSQPNKLDSPTGENGSLLSGGQRQRLAIARATLANRPVIIFDEATSNVDCESEAQIWQAIHDLKGSRTIITISHRLSNIRHADHIYLMKNGSIKEHGSHEKLVAKHGEYASMLDAQYELESYRRRTS